MLPGQQIDYTSSRGLHRVADMMEHEVE